MRRRELLLGLATLPWLPQVALGGAPTDQRLLLVLLRGGLDGLAAIPPVGERAHRSLRGSAAVDGRPLDGLIGLHPSLEPLRPWWKQGDLAIVHAVGVPNGERSHFDAQDVLDNGTTRAQAARTGWLNRATVQLGDTPYALGSGMPLVLAGPSPTRAIDPSRPAKLPENLPDQLRQLWSDDPLLGPFEQALASQALLASITGERKGSKRPLDADTAHTIGALLAHAEGPRLAVYEAGGWDTHTNQAQVLERQLGALSGALVALRTGLGKAWRSTTIVIVSEFGRTVAANGTGGTDHGTGGVALLAGGAVAGGRTYGDWPGLDALYEDRDLAVTTDARQLFKGVLQARFGMTDFSSVFPDSDDLPALTAPFA